MTNIVPSPSGYTAQKFVEDVSATLPSALPLIHACGRLTTCVICCGQHDGSRFGTDTCTKHGKIVGVEIMAVCNACAASSTMLDYNVKNLCGTSGMFVREASFVRVVMALRELGAMVAMHGGLPLLLNFGGSEDD